MEMNSTTPGVRLYHKLTKYDVWLSPYVKMKCSMRKRPHMEWGRKTVLSRQKLSKAALKNKRKERPSRGQRSKRCVCVREREGVRRGEREGVYGSTQGRSRNFGMVGLHEKF